MARILLREKQEGQSGEKEMGRKKQKKQRPWDAGVKTASVPGEKKKKNKAKDPP